uniref:Uncharacterized protein n=1 Tax=Arundo donax TaxID=35708 RepID=A0A0A8YM81_ARUDO
MVENIENETINQHLQAVDQPKSSTNNCEIMDRVLLCIICSWISYANSAN